MGQRSQIYIRYRDSKGVQLIARYYSWNFGERMVSRARGIIQWLYDRRTSAWWWLGSQQVLTLERICDVNFDMRDVVISTCIKQEIREQFADEASQGNLAPYLFGQDNNDGQLLVDVVDGEIKYAFIPYYTEVNQVMSAAAYMEWNSGKSWWIEHWKPEDKDDVDPREYTRKNIQYISNHARLMTAKEVAEFLAYDYSGAVFGYPF